MLKITFLGHACFLLDDGTYRVLTDPFLSGNPLAAVNSGEVETDYIFVSHGHGDHVGDTEEIAVRCSAEVGGPVELTGSLFGKSGIKTIPGNIGGRTYLPFGSVKLVPAIHGSGVPGALACGFVFEIGEKRVYFAGDTALTKDMELLRNEGIDVALLPIGDVYTMGPEDAARAAWMIRPGVVVPMHYGTFPIIEQTADRFVECMQTAAAGIPVRVLAPGESLEYPD